MMRMAVQARRFRVPARLAAMVIVSAALGPWTAATACGESDLSRDLRRAAERVEQVERGADAARREADALRRENADLRRRQIAQATPSQTRLAAKPQAAADAAGITVVAAGTMAPAGVHLHGLDATPVGATPLTARYDWTVADAAGTVVHKSVGWSAAAVLDPPGGAGGEHVVTLRVTAPDGATTAHEKRFAVAADARRTVYVAADGNDAHPGTDAARPVRSAGRAIALIGGGDARVLFRRGDSFPVSGNLKVGGRNVCLRAYGDPAKPLPTLLWSDAKPGPGAAILEVDASADGLLIENLAFDTAEASPGALGTGKEGVPNAIRAAGGRNLVVRGCAFRNVGDAFNGNGRPTGVLVAGNLAPLDTGVRGYFVWGSGSDYVIERNRVANSTREHCVRLSGVDRAAVLGNDLTNLDRRGAGDRYDTVKGSITVQVGSHAYVAGNVSASGAVNVGPLGERDGLGTKAARWRWAVVEGNRVGQMLEVKHGAEHVAVRGNRLDVSGTAAIEVEGFNGEYGRGVADVAIERNTAVNRAKTGSFLDLLGRADGVSLRDNLYVAPDLVPGAFNAGAVYILGDDLSSFAAVGGNVWPTARPLPYADGGVCFVGPRMQASGYRTPAEWELLRSAVPPAPNAAPTTPPDRFLPLSDPAAAPAGVGADPSAVP